MKLGVSVIMDAEKVAELVNNAVMKSEIKLTNLDYIEATRYLALNWTEEECLQSKLRRVLLGEDLTRGPDQG